MNFVESGGAGMGRLSHLRETIVSRKPRIVITVWKGLVDYVVSDIPIEADVVVVDRDDDKTEFQEFEIEVNPEKVDESYAEAEKFWKEDDD